MRSYRRHSRDNRRVLALKIKQDLLESKKSQGTYFEEFELRLQENAQDDPFVWNLKGLAEDGLSLIARWAWEQDDPKHEKRVCANPDCLMIFEVKPSSEERCCSDECFEKVKDQIKAKIKADRKRKTEQFAFDFYVVGGFKVEPSMAFADAAVPGGMRKVSARYCTFGQFLNHGRLKRKKAKETTEAATEVERAIEVARIRCGGRLTALLYDARDGASPSPPPPPPKASPDHPRP